ncbi:probable cytochrome P450 6a14 [Malaya genurostris]|uniref:probable cytochrome P450 6a14 n=1 Tax=Malaya genurostris TaxID=325434 RepID=UPI0026F3F9F1|nr:probable cytochrome P450 6a14 [Malaya genurostris]
MLLLYLSLLLLALAVHGVRKRFRYWEDRRVPYVTPTFPTGNLRGFGRKFHIFTIMERCYKQLKGKGPFGGIFMYTNPAALALDLDFVKNVLVKDFQYFEDRSFYYNEKDDPLEAHLVALEGTRWKNLRSKVTPIFSSGKMKMMFPTMIRVANDLSRLLIKEIEEEKNIEMKEILARYTTDVIGNCAFGVDCNSLYNPEAEFRQMGKKAFTFRFLKVLIAQQFREIARALHVTFFDSDVTNFFLKVVKDTVEYREKNNVQQNDFMSLLMQLKDPGPESDESKNQQGYLSIEEIAAQAFMFFLAGFETSSTTMSFCLYELSVNAKLQERARESVLLSIEKHGSMNYDAIRDMQFLEQCINESLRKYPPIASLPRTVTRNYPVPDSDGVVLRRGTTMVIPIYAIHHDSEYYPDPETYDPDRFNPDQVSQRNPFCFIPFGGGPRTCIGLRFGMMQIRIGLAILLKHFRFTVSSKTVVPLQISPNDLVLSFKGGLWLKLEKL